MHCRVTCESRPGPHDSGQLNTHVWVVFIVYLWVVLFVSRLVGTVLAMCYAQYWEINDRTAASDGQDPVPRILCVLVVFLLSGVTAVRARLCPIHSDYTARKSADRN